MDKPLWRPSPERAEATNITAFRRAMAAEWGVTLADHDALYQWSIDNIEQFWTGVWRFGGIIASREWDTVLVDGDKMPGAQWFPGARLNFAENLLRRRDNLAAMIFRGEDRVRRELSETSDLMRA